MYGSRLRYLRKKNNYTLNYVAEKLNTTHATISKYENEKLKIDPDTLCSFCKLYNVSADYKVRLVILAKFSSPYFIKVSTLTVPVKINTNNMIK